MESSECVVTGKMYCLVPTEAAVESLHSTKTLIWSKTLIWEDRTFHSNNFVFDYGIPFMVLEVFRRTDTEYTPLAFQILTDNRIGYIKDIPECRVLKPWTGELC